MKQFYFTVAQDIRSYGTVEVEADTLEDAIATLTVDTVQEKFESLGSGNDDFDWTPKNVHISDVLVSGENMEGDDDVHSYVEIDLFDKDLSLPYLSEDEAKTILYGLQMVQVTHPELQAKELIDQLQAHAKYLGVDLS